MHNTKQLRFEKVANLDQKLPLKRTCMQGGESIHPWDYNIIVLS